MTCSVFTQKKARIIICGTISQYNNTTAVQGPKNYLSRLVNRARTEGIASSSVRRTNLTFIAA